MNSGITTESHISHRTSSDTEGNNIIDGCVEFLQSITRCVQSHPQLLNHRNNQTPRYGTLEDVLESVDDCPALT